jgi:hypothetical protein
MSFHGSKRQSFWLIASHAGGKTRVLVLIPRKDKKVLPIFSSAEEAGAFLKLGAFAGYRAAEIGPEELISRLSGPCKRVDRVALDPPPEAIFEGMVLDLVSMDRAEFASILAQSVQKLPPA